MLTVSRWILIIAGVLLIKDSVKIVAGIPNLFFNWPLPCPTTLFVLGAGILLFGIASRPLKNK